MSHGRSSFLSLHVLILTIVFMSCSPQNHQVNSGNQDPAKIAILDYQKSLSGIWYPFNDPENKSSIKQPKKEIFSWGESTYDYSTALRIDLLGANSIFGIESYIWDRVDIKVDEQNKKLYHAHLTNPLNRLDEFLDILILSEGVIDITLKNDNLLAFEEQLVGIFYRKIKPN